MWIGIDVGGTNTDGVLIERGRLRAWTKQPTTADDLLSPIAAALAELLAGVDPARVERVALSTTLATNAIATGRTEPVGVLVAAGPGMDPARHRSGAHYHVIDGAIDHRGREFTPLDEGGLGAAAAALAAAGVRVGAVVGKFCTRNPAHEQRMAEALAPRMDFVAAGHLLSGQLNFPRRIHTARLNAAVWRAHDAFARAVTAALADAGVGAAPVVLKADGGSLPLAAARALPVQTIHSGPAASVMGVLATGRVTGDALACDIGGTTTDMALFAGGSPLLERSGIAVEGRPTLVRAIETRSLPLGGDSELWLDGGQLRIGPRRRGPAAALGGPAATPSDALVVLGRAAIGERSLAAEALAPLAERAGLELAALAEQVVAQTAAALQAAAAEMLAAVEARPVYTVHEMLHPDPIRPQQVVAMGGPAAALAPALERAFARPVQVAPHAGVANAIGAALARPTAELQLMADTERGRLVVPELGLSEAIAADFDLAAAERAARAHLGRRLAERAGAGAVEPGAAPQISIVEAESFNMVDGFHTTGRNIRVKAQVKPGLAAALQLD